MKRGDMVYVQRICTQKLTRSKVSAKTIVRISLLLITDSEN